MKITKIGDSNPASGKKSEKFLGICVTHFRIYAISGKKDDP
jgi:hypothetical protein